MTKKSYNGVEVFIFDLKNDVVIMSGPFSDNDNIGIDPFF